MFCVPGTVLGLLCLPTLVSGGVMGVFIMTILWIAITSPSHKKRSQDRKDPHGHRYERGRQGLHTPKPKLREL
jgi:hypothetical protein